MDLIRLTILSLLISQTAFSMAESNYLTMERSRLTAANQIQLYAIDLIDELIYEWRKNPPSYGGENLSLVSLDVPMGLNSKMRGIVENHFYSLIANYSDIGIRMSHCRSCTQLTAYNNGFQTTYGQGYDVLPTQKLGLPEKSKLLFLDFSVEDHYMVLRAKIVNNSAKREILYAKTIVKSSSEAPFLRDDKNIISKQEARDKYIKMLKKDFVYSFPLSIDVYSFEAASDAAVGIIPLVWWDISVEGGASYDRRWLFSSGVAAAYIPDNYSGFRVSGRLLYRLDSGYYSMARPRLYIFSDLAFSRITGSGVTALVDDSLLTPDNIIANAEDDTTNLETLMIGLKLGLQIRINRLYRFSAYIQSLPTEEGNANLSSSVIKSYGAEVGFAL